MTGLVAPFMITRNGTLVYRSGMEPEYRLLMRAPSGKIDTLPIAPKITSYARRPTALARADVRVGPRHQPPHRHL